MQALPVPVMRRHLKEKHPDRTDEELDAAIARSGAFLGQALELLDESTAVPPQTQALVDALCSGSQLELMQVLVPMEKWKRDALADLLQSWLELAENALAYRCGAQVLSRQARQLAGAKSAAELLDAAKNLKKAADYTLSNVSPAAVCGYLEWALR